MKKYRFSTLFALLFAFAVVLLTHADHAAAELSSIEMRGLRTTTSIYNQAASLDDYNARTDLFLRAADRKFFSEKTKAIQDRRLPKLTQRGQGRYAFSVGSWMVAFEVISITSGDYRINNKHVKIELNESAESVWRKVDAVLPTLAEASLRDLLLPRAHAAIDPKDGVNFVVSRYTKLAQASLDCHQIYDQYGRCLQVSKLIQKKKVLSRVAECDGAKMVMEFKIRKDREYAQADGAIQTRTGLTPQPKVEALQCPQENQLEAAKNARVTLTPEAAKKKDGRPRSSSDAEEEDPKTRQEINYTSFVSCAASLKELSQTFFQKNECPLPEPPKEGERQPPGPAAPLTSRR